MPRYGVTEIENQLKLNATVPEVNGSIFFNYKSLIKNPPLLQAIKTVNEQRNGIISNVPVTIVQSSENTRTKYSKYYLNGTSDPNLPLYLNGKLVEGRSKQGYFGILVPLEKGTNTFIFSQQGSYAKRTIYREIDSSTPTKMKSANILSSTVFPQTQEYRTTWEKIMLSCQAPIGSKVTVKLGGKKYAMKPSTTTSKGSGIYPTTYKYVYTIPKYTGTPRNVNLGSPIYTMSYKGIVRTRTAPAKIGVIMKDSPFYAKVNKSVIDTYKIPTSANGAADELYKGMIDFVTGMTNDYIRLSSGQWVRKSNVTIYSLKSKQLAAISKATYTTGEKWDSLRLDTSLLTAATATFDGRILKLNLSAVSSTAQPKLPEDSLFSSINVSRKDNSAEYTLALKKDQRIEGYFIETTTSSGLKLNIKRRVTVKEGDLPLTGITIMVDPGHG